MFIRRRITGKVNETRWALYQVCEEFGGVYSSITFPNLIIPILAVCLS